jgi:phytoene dehydrogenase-like protein
MSAQHDVIVIGGGLGGLSAAAKLARAGLDVRLLERHVQPGGYASTFYRDPYEFEISLHELSGIGTEGNRGPLYHDLESLGVAQRLRFIEIEHLYRAVAPDHGLDIRLPANWDGALETMISSFPNEERGLRRLFARFRQIQREVRAIGESGEAPSVVKALTRYPAVSHAAAVPLSALLYRELKDPLARMALGQAWSFFGLPPSKLAAVLYAGGLASYMTYGASYIEGKSQALSNAFVEVIEEAGGEVSLGDGVKRILTEGDRVTGVLTEHGEHLVADTIVANANPVTVALDLIGADRVPETFLRRLSITEPSISTVCVYLGLAADTNELGFEDHEVFINGTVDLEQQFRDAAKLEPPDSLLLTAYSVADPNFSPPGTSVAVLVALADGRAWQTVDPADYPALKQRYAEALVERASRIYPALPGSIEVSVVSTPLTNMRYTGNVAGAIYGFANTPAENPVFRLDQRGPLEGLWFAGAWTQPGGGFEPTISSGIGAAGSILAERGVDAKSVTEAA